MAKVQMVKGTSSANRFVGKHFSIAVDFLTLLIEILPDEVTVDLLSERVDQDLINLNDFKFGKILKLLSIFEKLSYHVSFFVIEHDLHNP